MTSRLTRPEGSPGPASGTVVILDLSHGRRHAAAFVVDDEYAVEWQIEGTATLDGPVREAAAHASGS